MNDIHDLDDYFNTDFNQDGFVPEKGIHRQKGRESVMIDGKLYWAPEALLDEFERLQSTLERMKRDTAIMHAIHTCSMRPEAKQAITYESGPYDITKLTVGIRDFVNTLITQAGESIKENKDGIRN